MRRFLLLLALLGLIAAPAAAQVPPSNGIVVNQTDVQGGTSGQCLYITSGKKAGSQACSTGSLPLAGGDLTGTLGLKGITETYSAPAIVAGTLTLDLSLGTVFNVASAANITTLTISNATAAKASSFTLILTGNGSAFTQSWTNVVWANGAAPVLTSTVAKRDILTFTTNDGGTTWFGMVGGQNF